MPEPWVDNDVLTAANLAGLPWGVMAYATQTAGDQTGITTATDITGLSVTFTAISTRLYKTTMFLRFRQITSAATSEIIIADGASVVKQQWSATLAANDFLAYSVTLIETGLSGSVTRKGRASTSAGTLTISTGAQLPAGIIVEDLGPG